MNFNAEHSVSTPGIPICKVLKGADRETLFKLLDTSVIKLIEVLDKNILSSDELGEFASQILDFEEILRNGKKLQLILNATPSMKIKELSENLGISEKETNIVEIIGKTKEIENFQILCTFFGVFKEKRAIEAREPDVKEMRPNYALFKYQREIADKVKKHLETYPNKVVLHMPTGAGKTRTAMHVVASHLRENENSVVVWLAQNAELLEQATSEFEKSWKHLGNREVKVVRFWGNRKPHIEDVKDGIIIAGLAKMSSFDKKNLPEMLKLGDRAKLVVIDEAHQAIAPTYSFVIETLQSKQPGNKLLGLTATPGRSWLNIDQDEELAKFFDRKKVSMDIAEYSSPVKYLIDEGYLAKPRFIHLDVNLDMNFSENEIKQLNSDVEVPDSVLDRLGSEIERNCQIVNVIVDLLTRHSRVIVFAPSVESARLLTAILKLKKYEAYLILGESDKMERHRLVRRFKNREIKSIALINFGVLTTGFDAPNVSAAVIARPTKSLVLYSQMVGRATRGIRAGGNKEAEIVTIIDVNLPGFGSMEDSFKHWEDVWEDKK